jgi:FixJ family two-component response regulator/HPt (histidine-containing phosphotransfer) domain-containing protein
MEDDLMIEEFKIEAAEMFESAEEGLLNIDKGHDFNSNYNSVFRSFHSLKGAAGMFGLESLQTHMHKLESLLEAQKKINGVKKHQIDYFLRGIDAARSLLDGSKVEFKHIDPEHFNQEEVEISKAQVVESQIDSKIPHENKNGIAFIIDDEQEIADNLTFLLRSGGIEVYTFYDAKNLLDALETIKPDVIVSDVAMPSLNGLEMLEAIRTTLTDAPVIFISAFISKDVMLEAYKYGAYDFIEKPYNEIKVLNLCQNAIKKSKTSELLEKSINYIIYQFNDLDNYLKLQGKESVRISLKHELQTILEQKKNLKNL